MQLPFRDTPMRAWDNPFKGYHDAVRKGHAHAGVR